MTGQKKSTTRKEQILKAAEQVFARKGYHDATISDVARQANVSDATIYEYFSSKEDLLFSLPGETARRGKENLEQVLPFIRSYADKIRAFVYNHLSFYQNHPDYAAVALLILKTNRKFVETEAYKDVQDLSRVLLQVIQEGIAAGQFRSNLDPLLVRSAILGTIEHLVIRQVLLGKPQDLVTQVDALTDLIVGGITLREGEKIHDLGIPLSEPPVSRNQKSPHQTRRSSS